MLQQSVGNEFGYDWLAGANRLVAKACLQRSKRDAPIQPQSQKERLLERSLRIDRSARRQKLFCASSDGVRVIGRRRVTLQRIRSGKAYRIDLIPTQIFFDASGKELFRHEGFFSKADILAKWKELAVDLSGK